MLRQRRILYEKKKKKLQLTERAHTYIHALGLVYFLGNILLQQLLCKCKNSCIWVCACVCLVSFKKEQRTLAGIAFIIFYSFFFFLKFYFFFSYNFFYLKILRFFVVVVILCLNSMPTIGNSFFQLKKKKKN